MATYKIITVNRNKETSTSEQTYTSWKELMFAMWDLLNTRFCGFKYEVKGTWSAPYCNVARQFPSCCITSFSAFKWHTCKEDYESYFVYVKKID